MFTRAERLLIRELECRPLEDLAYYFPQHTLRDINRELARVPSGTEDFSFLYEPNIDDFNKFLNLKGWTKKDYAKFLRKGNVILWDSYQEEFILELSRRGYRPCDMDNAFRTKFGIERSVGAFQSRLEMLRRG